MYIVFYLIDILIFLILIWICLFLVNFVHEMGHAIMYRIFFRNKNWHISIGTGKLIIKLKKFTIKALPISGFINYELKHKGSKLQHIMVSLGGPLANVFFIVLLIFLSQTIKTSEQTLGQQNLLWFLGFAFWMNVNQFIFTAIPMKYSHWPYKGIISDGMSILKKVREKSNV